MRSAMLIMGVVTFVLAALVVSAFTQGAGDEGQITKLMTELSDHSVAVTQVLDPNIEPRGRERTLARFKDPNYKLILVPTGEIQVLPGGLATVPVKVHFTTDNSEVETESKAEFVKRGEVWYFSNFDFVGFPTFIIIVIVITSLVGISYAATVVLLRNRLLREGQLKGSDKAKIFVPFFWPGLFRRAPSGRALSSS